MDSVTNRYLSQHLPFQELTDFDIGINFQSARERITELMDQHGLVEFLKGNYLSELFDPQDLVLCNYYDESEFVKSNRNSENNLNVISMNIRSLPKHYGELLCMLSVLETRFDDIILTEIGARNITTVQNIMNGYNFYYVIPENNFYGGVGIYVHNSITDVCVMDELNIGKSCRCPRCENESIFLKLTYCKRDFIVGGICRHPNGNVKHFVSDLEVSLDKIPDGISAILAGDINIDIIKYNNEETVHYLTTLLSCRFLPYITLPTRITEYSATCIDHIFVKLSKTSRAIYSDILAGMLYCDITDHLPCFVSLKCIDYINMNEIPKVRLYGERNCQIFVEMMTTKQWDSLYTENVDWYTAFINCVKSFYEQSFPWVTVSRKRIKDKSWISKGLKISMKHNHRLYKASLRNNNTSAVIKYKRYRNMLRRCINEAEAAYYEKLFQDTKSSSYNLWKHLGAIINPNKKKRACHINKLLCDGKFITDNKHISDSMNTYFCKIGSHLQQLMPHCGTEYNRYFRNRVNNTFFLTPVNENELLKEIKRLNPRKSSGADNIGARLVQLCPTVFAENLTKIYNNAMANGEYPVQLKIAKVIALYKKGEKYNPGNYRPISLLSCLNKLFEKILCKRLVRFLENNHILFDYQFGFPKLHSTTLALIELTDNIRKVLDEGNYAISVYVDLTKTFDTVDHEMLLDKMDRYGIRGHANDFFKSYLKNRKQYTVTNGVESYIDDVKCGVPQGSVLGPLLFSLYINDIYRAVGQDYIRLFADDTALFMYNENLNSLIANVVSKFNELYLWCVRNKLTINCDKTNFILFHATNKPIPKQMDEIVTSDMTIKRVKSFQYLGLTLDETLRFK